MDISFLKFENGHREYVWLTYVNAIKPYIEKIWGWEEKWQKENYSNSLEIYSTYILMSEEQRLGYIQFKHDENHIFLSMIILEDKYQSKGYGSIIIDEIQALKNGFKLISSDNEFHTLYRD